ENKTAVVKLTVLFEQVTKVDAFVEIANLGNEQHMMPVGCSGAGVRQHSLTSSGAKRNNNNGLGVIVIRVLAAYLFCKLARIVEDISDRFEGIGYVNITKSMNPGYAARSIKPVKARPLAGKLDGWRWDLDHVQ